MRPETRFKVFSRQGCHLCEDMLEGLSGLQSDHNFSYEVIDIDEDAALLREYNDRVPVLCHEDHVICQHYLDLETFLSYLERHANI